MINITRVSAMLHGVWSTLRTPILGSAQQNTSTGTASVNTKTAALQFVKTTRRTITMSLKNVIRQTRDLILVKLRFRRYTIGEGFHAGLRVRIWGRDTVVIGRNFYIGRDSFIETDVNIGDNVMFGNRVAIVGRYDHHYQLPGVPIRLAPQIRDPHYKWKGLGLITTIENDVWIGYGSTVMGGVTIGEGSIIGAGSLVTKDVEPYSIYAGTPARKIRDRFDNAADLQTHLKLVQSKYYGKL
ncbi:MAG TPA: DapH/DapD/GlmU-related protein [Niastella sp.]|nr:DapH/DapD/GlmU-related protein [Niastella sp.]